VIIEASRPRWALIAALIAAAFGFVTIAVGGSTLVSVLENRDEAGNIVNFVLWFNFLAGFAYVAAAVGLFFLEALGGAIVGINRRRDSVCFYRLWHSCLARWRLRDKNSRGDDPSQHCVDCNCGGRTKS